VKPHASEHCRGINHSGWSRAETCRPHVDWLGQGGVLEGIVTGKRFVNNCLAGEFTDFDPERASAGR